MNIEERGTFKAVLVASFVMIVAIGVFTFWAWAQIAPDAKIPVHWGIDGKADGYGSRNFLWVTPGVMVFLSAMFFGLPYIEPRKGHLLKSSKAYKVTWMGMLVFFSIMQGAMIFAALGREVPVATIISAGVGVLFVAIGNYMGKVRSNFFFGARTPWTLSSELSWNKTNRACGRYFVIWGIAIVAVALVAGSGVLLFALVLGGALLSVVFVFVYSYRVWKNDPAREKPVWVKKNLGE